MDNRAASFLGWRPNDNAGDHRARIMAEVPKPAPTSSSALYQGGPFVEKPIRG